MVHLLIAAAVVLAAPTPPAAGLALDLSAPRHGVEAAEEEARTRAWQQAQGRQQAWETRVAPEVDVAALLEQAQAECGEPPQGWARVWPGWEEPRPTEARRAAAARIETALAALYQSQVQALEHLLALEGALEGSPHREQMLARLRQQRQRVKERTEEVLVLGRRAAAGLWVQERSGLRHYVRTWAGEHPAALLARARERVRAWDSPAPPPLGAELSYVHGALQQRPLPEGEAVTPAYLSQQELLPELDDSAEGGEVELSAQVRARAEQLGNAWAAWEYVRGLRLEWYAGSTQGATHVLRQGRGNDADLASLLVALLRAQGTPARYVHGLVELPLEQVAAALGLLTEEQVAALEAEGAPPPELLEEVRRQVLQALGAAGLAYQPVESQGRVVAVQVERIWVEAYLPYGEYRGAGEQSGERQWVPLEVGLGGRLRGAARLPAVEAYGDSGQSAEQLTVAYLAQAGPASPLHFLRSRVEAWLAPRGLSYEQALRTVQPRPEQLELLPGTLPYRVVKVQGESAFLPQALQQRVRLVVEDGAGPVLEAELPLHQLAARRSLLTYVPATEADSQLVSLSGGLYRAPAALVEVVPVLRVEGQPVARGQRAVGLGADTAWSLELRLPGGQVRRVSNRAIAGNVVALGVGAPGNAYTDMPPQAGDEDGPGSRFLYGLAAAYAQRWTESEEELSQLLRVALVRPTASFVFVQNQLQVDSVLGVRQRVQWKGLEVDADWRTLAPVELVPGRGAELLRLAGYQGAWLEAHILEQGTGVRAVASPQVLQLAQAQGTPLLSLTPANQATQLPRLSAPPEVYRDVVDQLALGRHVLIPSAPLSVEDWSGMAWIAHHPDTQEAGYFLSGRIAGGQTVLSPARWDDEALLERLQRPDAPAAIEDTSLAARIVKVVETDLQQAEVGTPLPRLLSVVVTTLEGVPVQGAQVRFSSLESSKPLLRNPRAEGSTPAETITVTTDMSGRALVEARPDTSIARAALLSEPRPNRQRLGFNRVTADLLRTGGTTVRLSEPFVFIGLPGPLATLEPAQAALVGEPGVELPVPLRVVAKDRHGNVLANQQVVWTATGEARLFDDTRRTRERGPVQVLGQGDRQVARLEQVTPTEGELLAGYVPAWAEGAQQVVARGGPAGGVSQTFQVQVVDTQRYVLRVMRPPSTRLDGVVGMHTPEPYVAQLLRKAGNDWQPVRGNEADIALAQVRMEVARLEVARLEVARLEGEGTTQRPALLRAEAQVPYTLGTGATQGLDTQDNVVFWPRYETRGGVQRLTFTATVEEREAGKRCCEQTYFADFYSAPVEVALKAVQPGGATADTNACGRIRPDQEGLEFEIGNPAGYALYARVVQRPNVPGQQLVALPLPGTWPVNPARPELFVLQGPSRHRLRLPRVQSSGGNVELQVLGVDPRAPGAEPQVLATKRADLDWNTPATTAEGDELRARVVLLVRNFESTANPELDMGLEPTVEPLKEPALLRVCMEESGLLQVRSGGTLLVDTAVQVGNGESTVVQVTVPPGDVAGQQVHVMTRTGNGLERERRYRLNTVVEDYGAMPVGHTFVKDVSVVDGHLARQWVDVELPGRGGGLRLGRTYTSRGGEASPLGRGWSHAYRGYVLASSDDQQRERYVLVGGEGTGQEFRCAAQQTNCLRQKGYHGTLRGEQVTQGPSPGRHLVYRSKGGTEYRYGPALSTRNGKRHPLLSIRSPEGQEVTLEYGGADVGNEVVRVYEPGRHRYLQLEYEWPLGAPRPRLVQARLMKNGSTPESLGVCVAYGYNSRGEVARVRRYEGECGPAQGEPGPGLLRQEAYEYQQSPLREEQQNNLTAYTDPNGVTTRYEYYTEADALPGETQYLRFGSKAERVKRVVEPLGVITAFSYSLVPVAVPMLGQPPVQAYETRVKGPRPEVPETVYRLDGYGGVLDVERPVAPGVVARQREQWHPVHVKPELRVDARGRVTRMVYDDAGNLVERRTEVPVLAAAGEGGPTQAVVDTQGQAVGEVVEKWTYDPAYSLPTCQVDAEGRITRWRLDSNEVDPREGLPQGTGRVLETRQLARKVTRQQLASSLSCLALAQTAGESAQDLVARQAWCGVGNTPCPTGAQQGDWAQTMDARQNVTRALRYNPYGYLELQERVLAQSFLQTEAHYDTRGRKEWAQDGLGHRTESAYDGLDRPVWVVRRAGAEGSADEVRTFEYYPAGQVKTERSGLPGHVKQYTLDGLNRLARVEEWPGQEQSLLVTEYGYDEAGNRTRVTDRRGVTTTTVYDWGDRPVETRLSLRPEDERRYLAQGGVTGAVGLPTAQGYRVAAYGYDAEGNKVWEEDRHGYRTEYVLDSLYRVVGTRSPQVPGESLTAPPRQYETRTRYDLTGNVVEQVDGNGNRTAYTHDFASRQVAVVDAVGRREEREYDGNGNVVERRRLAQGTLLYRETLTYDALERPLSKTERFLTGTGTSTWREQQQRWTYDNAQRTIWERDARGYLTKVVRDGLDREVERVVDAAPAGAGLQMGRTGAGQPLQLRMRYGYDALSHRVLEEDALGRQTAQVYDGLGRLLERRRPMGVVERYGYDGGGRVVSRVDGRGVEQRMGYDLLGREVQQVLVETLTNAGQPLTVLRRTYQDVPEGGLVRVEEVDSRNATTVRYLDGLGREVRQVDALWQTREARYDAAYKRVEKDARGYTVEFGYDGVGRKTLQREQALRSGEETYTQSWAYAGGARQETYTDRRGIPTMRYLDGLGRAERQVRGQGSTVREERWEYDEAGLVAREVDGNGNVIAYTYDGARQRTRERRAVGRPEEAAWSYTYDAAGNRVEEKGPRETGVAYDVRTTYDDLNRPVREEDGLGHVTVRAFDAVGNKVCEKKPKGRATLGHGAARGLALAALLLVACEGSHVTRWEYDEANQLLTTTDALGGVYSFVYDTARNLVAKQDANGNLTTYEHDLLGRRMAEHQHLDWHARLRPVDRERIPGAEPGVDVEAGRGTLTWRWAYDANGNIRQSTDPKGQTVESQYGVLDRLAQRIYSNHALPRELPSLDKESFRYDGNGNLLGVRQEKQTAQGLVVEEETRQYDALDRLEWKRRQGREVRYRYDAKGNRLSVVDAEGVATEYTYDGLDRVATAQTPAGTTRYRHWPDGLLQRVENSNGVQEGRCYDAAGRLLTRVLARGQVTDTCAHTGTLLSRQRYDYDENGNRLRLVEERTNPTTQQLALPEETRYGFDRLDRLVGVAYPDSRAVLYKLDPVGNRLGEREAPANAVATLGPEAYEAVTPSALTRDVTLQYNRLDWLLSSADARQANAWKRFTYDLNGNLTSKQTTASTRQLAWDIRNTLTAVYDNSQESGRYDYDHALQRVKRRTSSEDVEYLLDEVFVLQEFDTERQTKRRYHYAHAPLAVSDTSGPSTTTRLLHTDVLGSVDLATSTSGPLATARQYDTWGSHIDSTAPTASDFKLGYTGHQFDPETGLTYARARYYDSDLGRFISRDPYEGDLSDAPSLHRYAYAHGNPLHYRDDDGRSATAVGTAIGFAWGVGQAIGGAVNDCLLWSRGCRQMGDYASIVAQNTIAGAELGLSIDATVISGGTGFAVSGALGGAGLNALTFMGQAEDWSAFSNEQLEGGIYGAVGGVVIGKAAPLVGAAGKWAIGKIPGGTAAMEEVAEIGGRALGTLTSKLPKVEWGKLGAATNPFGTPAKPMERVVVEAIDHVNSTVATAATENSASRLSKSILESSAKTGQIPRTSIAQFDTLAKSTKYYEGWLNNIRNRGYEITESPLSEGTHAYIQGKAIHIDPGQFTYLDLLHESRHIAQIERAARQGMTNLNKKTVAIFEQGAYEYELRLAQRFGFSEEYKAFAQKRIDDYWTPALRKKLERSQSFQELLKNLWR